MHAYPITCNVFIINVTPKGVTGCPGSPRDLGCQAPPWRIPNIARMLATPIRVTLSDIVWRFVNRVLSDGRSSMEFGRFGTLCKRTGLSKRPWRLPPSHTINHRSTYCVRQLFIIFHLVSS